MKTLDEKDLKKVSGGFSMDEIDVSHKGVDISFEEASNYLWQKVTVISVSSGKEIYGTLIDVVKNDNNRYYSLERPNYRKKYQNFDAATNTLHTYVE